MGKRGYYVGGERGGRYVNYVRIAFGKLHADEKGLTGGACMGIFFWLGGGKNCIGIFGSGKKQGILG